MRLLQHHILRLLAVIFLNLGLGISCSSDQQQQDEDLEESDQQQAAEADDQQEQDGEYEEDNQDGDLNEINELSQQTTMTEDGNDAGGMNSMGMDNLNNMNNLNDLSNGISDLGGDQGMANNGEENQMAGMDSGMSSGSGSTMGPPPADNSDRVVRFILADETPVYGQPDASSGPVATMYQGDPVVVAISGEWGQLTEGRFIMSSSLSEMIVPRSRAATDWAPPAQSMAGP